MAEISREEAVRYLLGSATDAEKEALEKRFFQGGAAEEMGAFEDELVDDYVAGRLSGAERTRFEQTYLASPERAAKVDFARALRSRLAPPQGTAGAGSFPRLLALAAAIVVGLAGVYFAYRLNESRRELARLQEQQASLERRQKELSQELSQTQAERARLEKELEQTRKEAESYASQVAAAQREVAGTIAFTLAGGLTRDTSAFQKTLEIPSGVRQVKLSMSIPAGQYTSYTAEIRTPEGKQIWRAAALAARRVDAGLSLDVIVPARLLASGDYILSVIGVGPRRSETAADFSFRVRKP
jgi:Skp family chaperone for outer membrane proteins